MVWVKPKQAVISTGGSLSLEVNEVGNWELFFYYLTALDFKKSYYGDLEFFSLHESKELNFLPKYFN